jgi:hypothetical protein
MRGQICHTNTGSRSDNNDLKKNVADAIVCKAVGTVKATRARSKVVGKYSLGISACINPCNESTFKDR